LQQISRTVPIVFPVIGDPVAAGFIDSLARPGGNATGFMNFEFALSSKWLETIIQIAPSATRVGVLRDPAVGSGTTQFAVIQAAAPTMGMEATPVNMREAGEIAHSIESFAAARDGGLIVTAGAATYRHRDSCS
jgi:putative tryptophan/tyrosine transport system substrate-binding protein